MGLVHALASCLDCNWEAGSRNAMILAAQHHRKTGHQVMVEQCFSKTYLRDESRVKFDDRGKHGWA